MLLKNLQALRGIAALLVVLYHTYRKTNHINAFGNNGFNFLYPFEFMGYAGVDLFFVISGFIITYANFYRFGRRSLIPQYLLKRLIRIYPIYWFYTVLALLLASINPSWSTSSAVTSNIVNSILLFPQKDFTLLPVAWTLTYEIFFYILFSLMLFLKFRFLKICLLLYSLVNISYQLLFDKSVHPVITVLFNDLNLEFVFGCVTAILILRKTLLYDSQILFVGVIWFCFGGILNYWQGVDIPRVLFFGLPSALIVYGLISLETKSRYIMPSILENMGTASYSTYLSHGMVLSLIGKIFENFGFIGFLPGCIISSLMILITFVVGYLSFRFIEKPSTKFFQKRISKANFLTLK